jgi:hypothetical protein
MDIKTTGSGTIQLSGNTLDVNSANLNSTVAGLPGQAAINLIVLQNTIEPGTHFFDGIDMFTPLPTPPKQCSTEHLFTFTQCRILSSIKSSTYSFTCGT